MNIRYVYGAFVIIAVLCTSAFGQEQNVAKKPRKAEFYFNLSERGTGVGLKILYERVEKSDCFGYNILLSGVRGEQEYIYIDPYDPFQIPRKIGSKFFTLIVPFTGVYHKYVFTESIIPSLRPYIYFDVGPIYGVAFPRGIGGFTKSFKKGKGQITGGIFVGIGIEVYHESGQMFGAAIGYHLFRFSETLGELKDYRSLDLRISFIGFF